MTQYNKFARVYDQVGADQFSVDMVAYTMKIMKRISAEPSTVLDLCCGTGTALKLFHDLGMEVAGVDGSADMLRQARRKLPSRKIPLYRQRLPRLALFSSRGKRRRLRYDLITSYYDSLNYLLTERDLAATFAAVRQHMIPGGYFVFDMNTPLALETLWDDSVWGDAREDISWIWKNSYDPGKKMAECKTTFFVRSGKLWKRFDELHIERGYSNAVIKRLLRESQFSIRGFYRCLSFSSPTKRTMRVAVVAQRRK